MMNSIYEERNYAFVKGIRRKQDREIALPEGIALAQRLTGHQSLSHLLLNDDVTLYKLRLIALDLYLLK